MAEGRLDDPPQQQEREDQCDPDGGIRGGAIAQVEDRAAQDGQPRALEDGDAVRAAQAGGLAEQVVEHLPEGQRHHDEVHARGAQTEPADEHHAGWVCEA